jgi:hypothetical protein
LRAAPSIVAAPDFRFITVPSGVCVQHVLSVRESRWFSCTSRFAITDIGEVSQLFLRDISVAFRLASAIIGRLTTPASKKSLPAGRMSRNAEFIGEMSIDRLNPQST